MIDKMDIWYVFFDSIIVNIKIHSSRVVVYQIHVPKMSIMPENRAKQGGYGTPSVSTWQVDTLGYDFEPLFVDSE